MTLHIIPERLVFDLREPIPGDPEGCVFALTSKKSTGALIQRSPAFDPARDEFFTWTLRVEPANKAGLLDVTYFAYQTGAEVPGTLRYLTTVEVPDDATAPRTTAYHLFAAP